MTDFFENCNDWGPAEWFDRLAKAVREHDKAILVNNSLVAETCSMIVQSTAMRLVRDYESEIRFALIQTSQDLNDFEQAYEEYHRTKR